MRKRTNHRIPSFQGHVLCGGARLRGKKTKRLAFDRRKGILYRQNAKSLIALKGMDRTLFIGVDWKPARSKGTQVEQRWGSSPCKKRERKNPMHPNSHPFHAWLPLQIRAVGNKREKRYVGMGSNPMDLKSRKSPIDSKDAQKEPQKKDRRPRRKK